MLKVFDYEKVPVVEIVNDILYDSSERGASDIHFDPRSDGMVIRIRVDGSLMDYAEVPASFEKNLVTRVKIISGMNITESRLPQDGAIKTTINNKNLDMRVSDLPTNLGEKIVIRIMDYSLSGTGLESLGFSDTNLEKIMKMISLPNGIILVTGATGSGKSTTVYAMLQRLNNEETNIISVEDPVEMNIEGINQVQTNSEIGLDFAAALRSILRQDPNVIMIGEIRDTETAQIAVRSSITGHLVLSTIHTNDALNTIERLLDMNVERYLLATAIEGIVAQKLARKLCDKCKIERDASQYEKDIFKRALGEEVTKLYSANPDGCEDCHHGFKGRIPIHEVLLINTEIRDAITANIRKDELRELVYSQDVDSLLQDGLKKVLKGMTTVEELLKLIDLENDESSKDTKIGLKESLDLAEEREKKQRSEERKKREDEYNKQKEEMLSKGKEKEEEEEEEEDNEEQAIMDALKALNLNYPMKIEEPEEDEDDLLDRTSEIDKLIRELNLDETEELSEDQLKELLK